MKMIHGTGIAVLALVFCFAWVPLSFAGSSPRLNGGEKWRIGYYEGGPYSEYTDTMRTLVDGLIASGWITDSRPPEHHGEMPLPYMDWLRKHSGPYLSFAQENCYSANWDASLRARYREELLQTLKRRDLDLVIAMGTWAGLDLANNDHSVPVMVLSTSDPIGAGIIRSADNSGLAHVTARVDPTRYQRQLRMFHRIVGFDRLGIAFEDTPDGRIYAAIAEAEQIARERNFEVVTCKVIDATADIQASDRSCLECYRGLARKADAIYVTALTCTDRNPKQFADIFRKAGVPSFSMVGSKWVKAGVMLSISSDSGYAELGRYNASKFGDILNGKPPGTLNQVFEDPLDVAVNMETVRAIGFDMPQGILRIAAEIYGD